MTGYRTRLRDKYAGQIFLRMYDVMIGTTIKRGATKEDGDELVKHYPTLWRTAFELAELGLAEQERRIEYPLSANESEKGT